MAAVSANKLELLQIADAVAREKSIDRGIVIAAMEDAIAKAARARYGSETDVHAEIDAKKGELRLSRHMLVVENVENHANQISLADARRANPGAQIGVLDPHAVRHRRRLRGADENHLLDTELRQLVDEARRQVGPIAEPVRLAQPVAVGREREGRGLLGDGQSHRRRHEVHQQRARLGGWERMERGQGRLQACEKKHKAV